MQKILLGWVSYQKVEELKGFSYDTLKNWRSTCMEEGVHFKKKGKNYIYHFENLDQMLSEK
ncbi:excisionase family protein [Thalassotalea litorea]|uniref:excisionase family protein n=1 Tax=Thalassotalea litorea TaxID=2020715 RepID=UPI003734FFE1